MLIDDILSILAAAGHGTVGTTLQAQPLAEDPIVCVGVQEYQGSNDMRTHASPLVEQPRFQVLARDPDQRAAWVTAKAIRATLRAYTGGLNGILDIEPIGTLGELKQDPNFGHHVVGSYSVKLNGTL